MKRVLALFTIFMSILCSSVFLVSCSNGYKKMYLEAEYALPGEADKTNWQNVDLDEGFDYFLEDAVYSESDSAYLLYLKVNVKGTSKKVNSLHISLSATNSTMLESSTVKPGEPIKVLVDSIGSVKFTVVPSDGGSDKAISFTVNIYEKLESIKQNEDCVPALVTGGSVKLNQLKNLIDYYPLNKTNQTGVSFELDAIGTLTDKVEGEEAINGLVFSQNYDYDPNSVASLEVVGNDLLLKVAPNSIYGLSTLNNVIRLKAVSNYYSDKETYVYVYVVENFTQESLLVSYNNNIGLVDGFIPAGDTNPVGDEIEIFASDKDADFRTIKVYTYTSESIYSFISEPGMKLKVYINGIEYDYMNEFEDDLGIKISKADDSSTDVNSIGLKFEALSTCSYNVKLVVDFEAFDFSASDKSPLSVLTKEIKVNVKSLASAVAINGKTYDENLGSDAEYNENLGSDAEYVKNLNDNTTAVLYSSYNAKNIGLPLQIQAVPTDAIDSTVYVSFYSKLGNKGELQEINKLNNLQLMYAQNWSLSQTAGKFEVKTGNRLYLKFSDDSKISNLSTVYMVCEVKASPDKFKGETITTEYKTIIVKFDVVGAVKHIYVYNQDSIPNPNEDTLNNTYLSNGAQNTAYIHLSSGVSGVDVDASLVEIKSSNNIIRFSANGINWYEKVSADMLDKTNNGLYKLYFKSIKAGEDTISITSPNGVTKPKTYTFVDVTSSTDNIAIDFEKTYIWQSDTEDTVYVRGQETELKYLALQAGRSVDFEVFGDGKNYKISDIEVQSLKNNSELYGSIQKENGETLYAKDIATFNANAVITNRLNNYMFNIKANSVGFTSVVLIKVDFYVNNSGTIELQSKYFLYEIAVYNQAQNLTVNTDKDTILYVNENYRDVARVRFDVSVNSNVTQNIYFSSSTVNEKINSNYGDSNYNSIYGICVNKSVDSSYFSVTGLNEYDGKTYLSGLTKSFSIQALDKLEDLNQEYIYVDFVIYQFGGETTYSIRKVIYFGDYVASDGIVLDGVDAYKNVYLSLLDNTLSTKTIYATVANDDATYQDLDYELFTLNTTTKQTSVYTGINLTIDHDSNSSAFVVSASGEGGTYLLRLYAKDSYNNEEKKYKNSVDIVITVSDGASEETAYLIGNLNDFKYIANSDENLSKYYRLSNDINISALNNADWWDKSRIFTGSLDGAMTIYNANNGAEIHKQYSLIGLTIKNSVPLDGAWMFGLFTSNQGTIKNIIFDRVNFDISISNNVTVNIGAIAGVNHGKIENCSVSIIYSTITLTSDAADTTYNIGLITGANYKTISYDNTQNASNYAYMLDCNSAGILKIVVESGNTNYGSNTNNEDTNIYVGGIAGQNIKTSDDIYGLITSTYADNSSQALRAMLTGVVNIELIVGDELQTTEIMNVQNIALGGAVGYNTSTIRNVAISGKVVACDKVSMGGVVGINEATVQEVANLGMVLEAGTLSTYQPGNGGKLVYIQSQKGDNDILLEQNIGGIIGENNGGTVDNVRTQFIWFEAGDVSVETNNSKISGVGNIGGIIGKATNTTLTRAYVENFVDNAENNAFNIIGTNANIAGFIAESTNSKVTLGFVQANFDVGLSTFYEFGNGLNYNYVYFIGDVAVDNSLITISGTEENGNLSVALNNHNAVKDNVYIVANIIYNDKTSEFTSEIGVTDITLNTEETETGYSIRWLQDDTDATINNGYPYLVYLQDTDEIYTITIQPSQIIVNVDEKYFENEPTHEGEECFVKYGDGIFIQYTLNEDISATAIVYYNVDGDNTHKLVTEGDNKGLIEKTILPSLAEEKGAYTYSVKIVSGTQVATLTGDSITFKTTGRVELEFVSLYNRNIKDRVVIFVENKLAKLADNVFSTEISQNNRSDYSTHVGSNILINIALNSVDNATFDEGKTYSTVEVISVKDNKKQAVTNTNNMYFEIDALNAINNGYALGNYEFITKDLPDEVEFIEVELEFAVYLNLSKYNITSDNSLQDLTTDLNTQIGLKTLKIRIFNSAEDVQIVSSDATAQSGNSVDIEVLLTTGYINDKPTTDTYTGATISNDYLNVNATNHNQDSINIRITADNDGAKELVAKVSNIWDLFDTIVTYKYVESVGYNYNINIELKDDYKYITTNCEFTIRVYARSKTTEYDVTKITFVPQQLTTFRMEHYANLVVKVGSDNATVTAEYIASESQSSLIIPGYSGLMKIYAEPTYAYCDDITITSSRVTIDGKEYFIRYQQMVYNTENQMYESLAGITAEGETLSLLKRSYKDTNGYSYDGVIFVRTILENVVGVKQTFTSTITATTYDIDGKAVEIQRDKVLISQYKPGVYISVSDVISTQVTDNETKEVYEVYLVEKGTGSVKITAKVYGYEFNIKPTYAISWVDGSTYPTANYIAVVEDGEIVKGTDNAYYITYTLRVSPDCPNAFKISFEMTLVENGNELTSNKEVLTFYPVDYLVKSVGVNGVANGILDIGIDSSKDIQLVWSTMQATNDDDKQTEINDKIYRNLDTNFLKLFYIEELNNQFKYERKYFDRFLQGENDIPTSSFKVIANGDRTYRIKAISKASVTVYVDIYYGYVYDKTNDSFSIKFSHEAEQGVENKLHYEFNLVMTAKTSEDAPKPLYNSNFTDIISGAGENYILMEDIVVSNWIPLTTQIASLDGNGHIITINSFDIAVQNTVNAGFFASIAEDCIIKNLVIDISQLENETNGNIYIRDENTQNVAINFGVLAGENKGLVYNCEVISLRNKTINLVIGDGYTLNFGALVGVNSGNITNSRVGTEYFEKITLDANHNPSSTILRCGDIKFVSRGVIAGLVAVNDNDAIISSCYMANTSLENTSHIGDDSINMTAGFVATNNGLIAYSYVKGKESSILTTRARATGASIYASGAGSVAGFVFVNNGQIHDSYSNIICKSNSAVVSGFVYENSASASIYQCYTASTVWSGNTDSSLATELPFVGIGITNKDAGVLLSKGELQNCYYLDDGTEYDTNYLLPSADADLPINLTLEGFARSSNLNNYAFVENAGLNYELNGVWTYSTAIDKNKQVYSLGVTSLPELTSANQIARSVRYLKAQNVDELYNYDYANANGYAQGSSKNPYIIRNAEEYKDVFVNTAVYISGNTTTKSKSGYFRLIDNIDFKNEDGTYINIETKSNYVLGAKSDNSVAQTLSVLDGNGMTISNVFVNYGDASTINSIGLFSEVYSSILKAFNVEYVNTIGSSQSQFTGGIAGIAKNVYVIDIDLTNASGSDIEVKAQNVAGGVVGIMLGQNSGIFNVSSNLLATAGVKNSEVRYQRGLFEAKAMDNVSYAGGIAGIIDIDSSNDEINVSRLTVTNSKVVADRAGGIVGYLSAGANAQRLKFVLDSDSQINGSKVAGGLIGENFGSIKLSQIGAEQTSQEEIDKQFASYINTDDDTLSLDSTLHGNLNAVVGQNSVGGLIGVNYGGNIEHSLTKASVGAGGTYVGGLIGTNYGGSISYTYAQNHIDISGTSEKYVGGLFGYLGDIKTLPSSVDIKDIKQKTGVNNVVLATMFDKSQVSSLYAKVTLDYIVGKVDKNTEVTLNSDDNNKPIINYGVFNTDGTNLDQYKEGKIKNSVLNGGKYGAYYDMESLYNLQAPAQKEIFESLFILWDNTYWDLDNTKFMPTLKENTATNFIPIKNKDNLSLFEQHPDGNFILMNDVEVGTINANYVANINFTGVLIGKLQDDGKTYPSFTNITLEASTSNSRTSGFFKQTTGARISNVGFKYNQLKLTGDTVGYDEVGGVSARDTESRFEQVFVEGQTTESEISGTSSVKIVGTFIGTSERSTIIAGRSSLPIDINASSDATIGGLIGNINGFTDNSDNEEFYEGLVLNSSYSANLTINASNASVKIGGLIGSGTYTTISDSNFNGKVTLSDSSRNNIGGIVGYTENCLVMDCGAEFTINKAIASVTSYIGGVIGYDKSSISTDAEGSEDDEVVIDSYSIMTIDSAEADNNVEADSLSVGGIIGYTANYVSVTRVSSEMHVTTIANSVNYLVIGGIIGEANNGAEINSSMAYMKECDLHYTNRLLGGGLIGYVKGNYTINNSTSMGQLFANNDNTDDTVLTSLGGMVGFVGNITVGNMVDSNKSTVEGSVTNSYTVLTISTAKVYRGTYKDLAQIEDESYTGISHYVYSNAIVGYNNSSSAITIDDVIYSADYTLTLDDDVTKFTSVPVNVTASALLHCENFDTTNLGDLAENDILAGNSWYTRDGNLPVPITLCSILNKIGILLENGNNAYNYRTTDADNNPLGEVFSPIMVYADSLNKIAWNSKNYSYYVIQEELNFDISSDLKGVILGNNRTITTINPLFTTITNNSAVSNINLVLNGDVADGGGSVATTNKGTIFMCNVNYSNITVTAFGGLVQDNLGRIDYCSNTGYATVTGSVGAGGLAINNGSNAVSTASIENSYFTGKFEGEGSNSAALSYTNYGYIANCYTAGNSEINGTDITGNYFVIYSNDSARYENNYFDYYANFVKADEEIIEGVTPISTAELQYVVEDGSENHTSNVLTNWLVYSMVNPNISDGMTYNYGYPIYNFNQYTLVDGGIQITPFKAKQTGDGTYTYPYIINNVGVLWEMNKVDNTAIYGADGNTIIRRKYFELECNITLPSDDVDYLEDGDTLISDWKGLFNGEGRAFKGVFTTSMYATGTTSQNVFDTAGDNYNSYKNVYLVDKSAADATPRKITNLRGAPLFGNVDNNAVIANVTLSNSYITYATLINNAVNALIYNVEVEGNIIGRGSDSVAGLINQANGGTLILNNVDINDCNLVAENSGSVSGLFNSIGENKSKIEGEISADGNTKVIVDKSFNQTTIELQGKKDCSISGFAEINYGEIKFLTAGNFTIKGKADANNFAKNFSGFVGVNYYNIQGSDTNVTIGDSPCEYSDAGQSIIAGLVGTMNDGYIAGFNVKFSGNNVDNYSATIIAGAVGVLNGGKIGEAEAQEDGAKVDEDAIQITLTAGTAEVFGGVVGKASGGSISNVKLRKEGDKIPVKSALNSTNLNSSNNDVGYGLIIGVNEGYLNEIYFTIDSDITFEVVNGVNVGGIIGLSKNGGLNISGEKPQGIIKVLGVINVGGLIGKYTGGNGLTLKSKWAVQEEYAKVGISVGDERKGEVQDGENFGGLIGYWASTTELQCTINGEDTDNNSSKFDIINRNQVLTSDCEVEGKMNAYNPNADVANKYSITCIGGVIGLSNARITSALNTAEIGYKNVEKKDVYSFDDDNFRNYKYVGGIVGQVQLQEDAKNSLILTNCANTGAIFGYVGVGGLVGYSNNSVEILGAPDEETPGNSFDIKQAVKMGRGADESATTEETMVAGFSDVGGLIGRSEASLTITLANVESNVIGYVNVGGLVGYAKDAININKCIIPNSEMTIAGNLNVGGVAGYVFNDVNNINGWDSRISNIVIGSDSWVNINASEKTTTDVTICGIIYEDVRKGTNYGDKDVTCYFLPTNIGGVVGYAEGTVFLGVQTVAKVTTVDNYDTTIDDENGEADKTRLTVNMSENYMGNLESIQKTGTDAESYPKCYYIKNDGGFFKVDYDEVDTGIGGFAGYSKHVSFNTSGYEEGVGNGHDTLCYADTYAYYGINVGGIIGRLELDEDGRMINLPKLPNKDANRISVAGNMFVGGYIGKVNYMNGLGNSIGYIDVQGEAKGDTTTGSVITGNCIGGIVGYAVEGLKDIDIDLNVGDEIKIYNSNGTAIDASYVGVIAGRVDGNVEDCDVSAETCGATLSTTGLLDGESSYAYVNDRSKGIIQSPDVYNYGGLVGLVNVSISQAISIQGTHYYDFTVDTVQNQDYAQGTTKYSYNEESNTVSAIAHYVNKSNINISPSALNDLYDGLEGKDGHLNGNNSFTNDHNPTNPSARGWAKEYTMFRMMARLIPQDNELTGDSMQVLYNAEYITEVYTLTSADTDDKTLDTEHNADGEIGYHLDGAENNKKIYSGDILYTIYQPINQSAMLYCRYGVAVEDNTFSVNNIGAKEIKKSEFTVKDNNNISNRKYFYKHVEYDENNAPDWVKDPGYDNDNRTTVGYTYYENVVVNGVGYLGRTTSTYFRFATVFGRCYVNEDTILEDTTLYSPSGSLFEVCGTAVDVEFVAEPPERGFWETIWDFIKGYVKVSVGINIGVVTGRFGGWKLAGPMIVDGWRTAFPPTNEPYVQQCYETIENASYGMMHSNYYRTIKYTNGELDVSPDCYTYANVDVTFEVNKDKTVNYIKELYESAFENQNEADVWAEFANTGFLRFEEEGDEVRAIFKLALPYYVCSNANVVPGDIGQQLVLTSADSIGEGTATLFANLGATSMSIPKYVKVDNELYVCALGGEVERRLYQNYNDFEESDDAKDLNKEDYVDANGYLYTYKDRDGNASTWDDAKTEYFKQTYSGVNLTVTKPLTYNLVASADDSSVGYYIREFDTDDFRWNMVNEVYEGAPRIDGSSYRFAGLNLSDREAVLFLSSYNTTKTGYFDSSKLGNATSIYDPFLNGPAEEAYRNLADAFLGYDETTAESQCQGNLLSTTIYLKEGDYTSDLDTNDLAVEYQHATFDYVLTLYNDNKFDEFAIAKTTYSPVASNGAPFTSGKTSGEVGYTGNATLCYQYAEDGPISIPCTYYFDPYTPYTQINNKVNGETITGTYAWKELGSVKLNNIEYNNATILPEGTTLDGKELKTESERLLTTDTYDELKDAIIVGEDGVGVTVSSMYKLDAQNVLYSQEDSFYLSFDNYGFVYSSIVGESVLGGDKYYNYNKYVYNYHNEDQNFDVTFFTRYRYHIGDNEYEFFNAELDPNNPLVQIKTKLLPTKANYTGPEDEILFAESVRVTLSGTDSSTVYLDYANKETASAGRISCIIN